jgi:hypothetical protein
MSRPACLLLLVVLAAANTAAAQAPPVTSLTVDQLDRLLTGMKGTSDRAAASRLAGLKLTERVSAAQRAQWESQLTGNRTREALMELTDASAFLHPPTADIPADPTPDQNMQTQLRQRMAGYVKNTLSRLPNFVAQRTTTAFVVTAEKEIFPSQSMAQMLQQGRKGQIHFSGYHALGAAKASGLPDGQLYWLGAFSQTVTYRDGAEVPDSTSEALIRASHQAIGLTTQGEFGPMLLMVLVDAEPADIVWDHWERGATEPLAIFRFSVPRERSHFAVTYNADEPPDHPAYHGEIAVNPSGGEVFRITISANTHEPDHAYSSAILVEFGPTQIGGVTYICPVHGVAMTKIHSPYSDLDSDPPPLASQISINDVSFTNYHVFRSDSRVLTETPSP